MVREKIIINIKERLCIEIVIKTSSITATT